MKRPGLLLVFATAGAILGILAMASASYERYLSNPPTPPNPSPPPAQVTAPLTPRQVIVVVDSLREDAATDPEAAPNLARLRRLGSSGVNITPAMTITTMSVLNIGTGMTPPLAYALRNFDADTFEDESVFSVHATAKHRVALLGDASWSMLFGTHAHYTFPVEDTGFFKGVRGVISEADVQTFEAAERALADERWTVLVVHLTGSDKVAHLHGAHLREADGQLSRYARAVHAIDERIGVLWDRFGADSTWLILSDHGCNRDGNHGGGEEEARRAPFVWVGPGVGVHDGVEQPLTVVAPMISALSGLRPPRTAEQAARFELLQLSESDREALTKSHLAARASFVRQKTGKETRAQSLSKMNAELLAAEARTWLGGLSLGIGLLLQLLFLFLTARSAGVLRPWRPALLWTVLSWPLLAWGGWQFNAIQVLGELFLSPGLFLVRLTVLVAIVGLGAALIRFGSETEIAWVLWAFVLLVCGQITMRWPGGPIPEAYRTLIVGGLGLALAHAYWKGREQGPTLALLLATTLGLYVVSQLLLHDRERRLTDTLTTSLLSNGLLVLLLSLLAREALREDRGVQAIGTWVATAVTAGLAIAYQRAATPWMIWLTVGGCIGLVLWSGWRPPRRLAARNLMFAIAVVLYRALGMDARLIFVMGLVGIAWLFSRLHTRNTALTLPLSAGLVVLGQLSYFYEVGYGFSFSALDMSIAFAATRDAINLGEGFLFLMLQALGPWIVLATAAIYNRSLNGDSSGARTLLLALPCALVIQAWGAVGSFGYELANLWFTMHAVPLVLYTACNAALVGLALGCGLLVGLNRNDEGPRPDAGTHNPAENLGNAW